jgi:alkanesulfonate monooxygenase SsuD/methylene tetrahydromethanopterin reductase-like flavin-dependent oxidoreductase (luciferase family)
MGLPNKPIAIMRDWVTTVRALLRGDTVTTDGTAFRLRSVSLGAGELPPAPVYLGALGPQMVRLAGEVADGALLNWATPERISRSKELIATGAARAGRDPAEVPAMMYIRVCVDDDVAAARRAFGAQVLGYAMGPPGIPVTAGYRGMFGEMGFGDALAELESRRDQGTPMAELIDAAPDELFRAVGYYGPADGAAAAFARLSVGLDETVVRIITARPGPEPVAAAMAALTPAAIRAAAPA